jgi:hypothetical protein
VCKTRGCNCSFELLMMGVCRPKHVQQLRNIGIINSTTRLHFVGSFYEIYIYLCYSGLFQRRLIYSDDTLIQSVHPTMVLQPLLGHVLFQKTPPFFHSFCSSPVLSYS